MLKKTGAIVTIIWVIFGSEILAGIKSEAAGAQQKTGGTTRVQQDQNPPPCNWVVELVGPSRELWGLQGGRGFLTINLKKYTLQRLKPLNKGEESGRSKGREGKEKKPREMEENEVDSRFRMRMKNTLVLNISNALYQFMGHLKAEDPDEFYELMNQFESKFKEKFQLLGEIIYTQRGAQLVREDWKKTPLSTKVQLSEEIASELLTILKQRASGPVTSLFGLIKNLLSDEDGLYSPLSEILKEYGEASVSKVLGLLVFNVFSMGSPPVEIPDFVDGVAPPHQEMVSLFYRYRRLATLLSIFSLINQVDFNLENSTRVSNENLKKITSVALMEVLFRLNPGKVSTGASSGKGGKVGGGSSAHDAGGVRVAGWGERTNISSLQDQMYGRLLRRERDETSVLRLKLGSGGAPGGDFSLEVQGALQILGEAIERYTLAINRLNKKVEKLKKPKTPESEIEFWEWEKLVVRFTKDLGESFLILAQEDLETQRWGEASPLPELSTRLEKLVQDFQKLKEDYGDLIDQINPRQAAREAARAGHYSEASEAAVEASIQDARSSMSILSIVLDRFHLTLDLMKNQMEAKQKAAFQSHLEEAISALNQLAEVSKGKQK